MESRKQKEQEFHNVLRDQDLKGANQSTYEHLTSNYKFYSIIRKSKNFVNSWLLEHAKGGGKVLDYCCGEGEYSIFLGKQGIETVGIDISDISIHNCKETAKKEDVREKTSFYVMDAEATTFPDNFFDAVACLGVLHHLNTERAFRELARIVKPEGAVICDEPIAYNPLFQLYRKLTPCLRTEWEREHILTQRDLARAKKYFGKVEMRFFHLFTLGAVPFRNTAFFSICLTVLEYIDFLVVRIPGIRWLSWQIVFVLSDPKKSLSK